jgi:hypothetical protein
MAFLRVLLPKCGGELDSLYLKELAFILADVEAANKAKVGSGFPEKSGALPFKLTNCGLPFQAAAVADDDFM